MAQSSPIGRIDPSSLIGKADPDIVSPRAVSVLSDAFRSGQISANDIHDRVSERAKAKEKMEITLANRATAEAEDPALIEARRQQMLAAGAQGQLAGAQATAGLANVNEIEQLKLQMAQNAAQVQKYPMSTKFPELAAKYSVPTPRNPDGSLDYAKLSELGAQLVAHDAKIENAKSVWNSISKVPSADNSRLIRGVTHQGVRLSDEAFKAAEDATKESFFKIAPGAVATPATAPAPATPIEPGNANLVEPLPTPTPKPLPTVSTGVDEPAGTTLPGGDLGLGPPKATAGDGGIKMTGEQSAVIAKGNFTKTLFDNFKVRQKELETESPWLAGPVAGWVSKALMSQNWDVPVHNFESAKTAILAPMVKGIFQETGVLSQADVDRYDKVLPSITQSPEVQRAAIDNLERHIYDSIVTNYEAFPVQGIKPTPQATVFYEEAKRRQQELNSGGQTITDAVVGDKPAATGAAPAGSQPFLTLPPIGNNMFTAPGPKAAPVIGLSTGKNVQRDPATGRRVVIRQ